MSTAIGRETLVLELFAHDREDLAWKVADADAARLAVIGDVLGSPAPGRDRDPWIRALIGVLEGSAPADAPRRTRSPVLEMPDALRHRAHRNDVRDAIAEALARVRHTRAGWGWLVVDAWLTPRAGPTPFYVQFTSYPGPGIRAEAVGDVHLPEALRLDPAGHARMLELGWEPGSAEESDGNWLRRLPTGRALDRAAVADMALRTLEEGFGCRSGVQFRTEFGVWRADEVPVSGVTPA